MISALAIDKQHCKHYHFDVIEDKDFFDSELTFVFFLKRGIAGCFEFITFTSVWTKFRAPGMWSNTKEVCIS